MLSELRRRIPAAGARPGLWQPDRAQVRPCGLADSLEGSCQPQAVEPRGRGGVQSAVKKQPCSPNGLLPAFLTMCPGHLQAVKTLTTGLTSYSYSAGLGAVQGICISNKGPGEVAAAGPGAL